MQVSILYSFKTSSSTLCRGTVYFIARQTPAACQSSVSSACGSQKANSILISPSIQQEPLSCLKIENVCFSVWCMDVCVPSGTPVSNFVTWKHLPSKEAEKQFLSDTLLGGPGFAQDLPLLAILVALEEHYKMQSMHCMGCSVYIVLAFLLLLRLFQALEIFLRSHYAEEKKNQWFNS